jgi:orotidine-5'-phosphate decarboxylase
MNTYAPPAQRIIVALDVPDAEKALGLAELLGPRVGYCKVGLELFLAAGFDVVDRLAATGRKVMLDLKFHDIPETVKRPWPAWPITTSPFSRPTPCPGSSRPRPGPRPGQASGRDRADQPQPGRGRQARGPVGPSGSEYGEDWVADVVLSRAREALSRGADGVVCSGREAAMLRHVLGDDFLIVTPGIRPAGSAGRPAPGRDRGPGRPGRGRPPGGGTAHHPGADPAAAAEAIAAEMAEARKVDGE